jgi:hypothetical protein
MVIRSLELKNTFSPGPAFSLDRLRVNSLLGELGSCMKARSLKLVLLIIATRPCFSESKPTPVVAVKLNSIVSDQAIQQFHSMTVVFLSDSQLAVAFQNSLATTSARQYLVATLEFKVGSMSVLSRRDGMLVDTFFTGLNRTANGQLVVSTLPPLDSWCSNLRC